MTSRTPSTAAGRAAMRGIIGGSLALWRDEPDAIADLILAIEAEARASLDVERLAVVAAARALRERLTIDPGNVVSWGEWDTLDEALAKLGAKP